MNKLSNRVQFCPKGHDTFIVGRVSNGMCKICNRILQKEYKEKNQDKIKQDYIDNQNEYIQRAIKYYKNNREKVLKYHQKYYNENSIEIKSKLFKYRKDHPEILQLTDLKKHVKRSKRIPNFGQDGILDFYKNCPNNMQIDHIIPLCGKFVSGLHVNWNLQYLVPHDNYIKHNKANLIEISNWYGKILKNIGLK